MNQTKTMPLVALRGLILLPHMALHFDIGRKKSIGAVEQAIFSTHELMLCAQRDSAVENPSLEDLYPVGTVARVKQILKMPGDILRIMVEGVGRGTVTSLTQNEPFLEASVEIFDENDFKPTIETEALLRMLNGELENYAKVSEKISSDVHTSISANQDPSRFADTLAAHVLKDFPDKQDYLESFDTNLRLEKLYKFLSKEIDLLSIEHKISSRVKLQIDKSQKEFYLREQMKAISKELGDDHDELQELKSRIQNSNLPDYVKQKAEKEHSRLAKMAPSAPEAPMILSYLDLLLELPWTEESTDNTDFKKTAQILDKEHAGLEKVKERILEYLAVCHLKKNMKSPILCFVGPPGVGKTSIASSIAHALNRNFVRMSLGGVHDEAEIRGHRRTYIGSTPGRIINAMRIAKTVNPVFLLDEIEKMGNDFRGDPSSALLEVLDANQNDTFRDHYLELPYDLSRVMFIATANSVDTIPRPLLDRMEIINLSGYTEDEKTTIAKKHLLPKQLKEHGLSNTMLSISSSALHGIINYYTREAGVRSLERQIAAICRKSARMIVDSPDTKIKVTKSNLSEFLGPVKYHYDTVSKKDTVGVVTGLAWTSVGGETLNVEVATMPGNGELCLTGQLGDVMKESARAALSLIRSNSNSLGLAEDFHKKLDLHIHIPEGAIPKDGPSAGVTLTTAMVSALTGISVKHDVAMTGEITLLGNVLPIGGLKEKVLAAHRCGVKTVIIPSGNQKDIEEVPDNIRNEINFVFASDIHTVLNHALTKKTGV